MVLSCVFRKVYGQLMVYLGRHTDYSFPDDHYYCLNYIAICHNLLTYFAPRVTYERQLKDRLRHNWFNGVHQCIISVKNKEPCLNSNILF